MEIDKLAAALVKAQSVMKGAKKDSENPFFKSKYADLGAVWEACSDALQANGLAVAQTTTMKDGHLMLVTHLLHSSGQFLTGEYPIKPVKDDPQGHGSAMTYARRYALAAMVGVISEDDDGNAGSGKALSGVPQRVAPKPAPLAAAKEVFQPKAEQKKEPMWPTDEDEAGSAQEPEDQQAPPPPPAPKSGAQVITDKMGKRLYAKWKDAGKGDAQVRAYLKATYGYGSTRDIKVGAEYETICAWAEDKATTEAE